MTTTPPVKDQVLPLERILTIGITGSGKSYQWLKMAEELMKKGVIFRVVDTDNDIDFMLRTQFAHLLPENGGNVYALPVYEWPEYALAAKWAVQKPLPENHGLNQYLMAAYKKPMQRKDWIVADKMNNTWSTAQRYFVEEVFGDDLGDYFLGIRKEIRERGELTRKGKKATSTITEGLDGWKDWSVINRIYDDFVLPIVHRAKCNVYMASDVEKIQDTDKDPEVLNIFGPAKIKASGQKKLGGQNHSIFVFIPGQDKWEITTIKDRANRTYFNKTPLTSFFRQYMVMKAGWEL